MTKMRGVDDFQLLWKRRNTITDDDGVAYQVMSLPDLVKAKKTQRDKDWPMIRRLLEADYFAGRDDSALEQIEFWLLELRTPELLIAIAAEHREAAERLAKVRSLLSFASAEDQARLTEELLLEEKAERDADRDYWRPLKAELEQLRRDRLKN